MNTRREVGLTAFVLYIAVRSTSVFSCFSNRNWKAKEKQKNYDTRTFHYILYSVDWEIDKRIRIFMHFLVSQSARMGNLPLLGHTPKRGSIS